MKPAERVVKNTGILYIRMILSVFISLYSTRLILSALGTDDFGIFNLVGGAISMLMFLNASMTQATQRFMSYSQGEGDKGIQTAVCREKGRYGAEDTEMGRIILRIISENKRSFASGKL